MKSRRFFQVGMSNIGVLFRRAWSKIDGPGLDGFCSIYQGHLFFQKATYGVKSNVGFGSQADWGILHVSPNSAWITAGFRFSATRKTT